MNRLIRVLTIILCAIVSFIVLISAGNLLHSSLKTGGPKIGADMRRNEVMPRKSGYLSLGQIRVPVGVESGTGDLVVVTPWFAYPVEDRPFFEELSRKQQALKIVAANFFAHKDPGELQNKTEDRIKEELCTQINQALVLGQITKIYFEDYIWIP